MYVFEIKTYLRYLEFVTCRVVFFYVSIYATLFPSAFRCFIGILIGNRHFRRRSRRPPAMPNFETISTIGILIIDFN